MDTSVSPALWWEEKAKYYYCKESCAFFFSKHNKILLLFCLFKIFLTKATAVRKQISKHHVLDSEMESHSTCSGNIIILDTWEVTKRGNNCRLLKYSFDQLPHSFQVCMVAGGLRALNVCSANSNSISLGAQEPWGLKWTLVSLCHYSFAQRLLALQWSQPTDTNTHIHALIGSN